MNFRGFVSKKSANQKGTPWWRCTISFLHVHKWFKQHFKYRFSSTKTNTTKGVSRKFFGMGV